MGEPWSDDAVTAQVDMGTYLTGSATKTQVSMQVYQESWPVVTGRPVTMSGSVSAEGVDLEGEMVKIYTRDVGETVDTFVTEVPIEAIVSDDTSENTFRATIPAVTHTTTVTAAWDGNAGLPALDVFDGGRGRGARRPAGPRDRGRRGALDGDRAAGGHGWEGGVQAHRERGAADDRQGGRRDDRQGDLHLETQAWDLHGDSDVPRERQEHGGSICGRLAWS